MNVTAARPDELAWIEERTGCVLTRNARAIKATDSAGRIRGMVAYDCWTESAVQAHMAVDTPIAWRSLVGPGFSYPFEECGRRLIFAVVPSHNTKSWGLALRFGFELTHRVRDGWAPGDDLWMLEMRRENCRWLGRQQEVA